jgi:hypothetical protein
MKQIWIRLTPEMLARIEKARKYDGGVRITRVAWIRDAIESALNHDEQ